MLFRIDYLALAAANIKTAEFHLKLSRQYLEAGDYIMGFRHRNIADRIIKANSKIIAKMREEGR